MNSHGRPSRPSSTTLRLLTSAPLFDVLVTGGHAMDPAFGRSWFWAAIVLATAVYSLQWIIVLADSWYHVPGSTAPSRASAAPRRSRPACPDPPHHLPKPAGYGMSASPAPEAPAALPPSGLPSRAPADREPAYVPSSPRRPAVAELPREEQPYPATTARTVTPTRRLGLPKGGDGRDFPVLAEASRAADAPWQMPARLGPHALVADAAVLGGLDIRAASVVGPGHRARGVPRQDDYQLGQDDAGRYLIVAVADGMSDAKHSEVGARAATLTVVEELRKMLNRGEPHIEIAPRAVFVPAASRMVTTAGDRGWEPDDMRAVVIAAVIPVEPDAAGRRAVWLACVGDPSAYVLSDGSWKCLIGGHPTSAREAIADNHVSSYLPFYPSEDVPACVPTLADGDVLTLMTDGVADALEQVVQGEAWFADRWRQPPPVGGFLMDVGYKQVQMQDDRTAVTVWLGKEVGSA